LSLLRCDNATDATTVKLSDWFDKKMLSKYEAHSSVANFSPAAIL